MQGGQDIERSHPTGEEDVFNHELGGDPRLIDLTTPQGLADFSSEVVRSQGSALFIVHPYFHEGDDGEVNMLRQESYPVYLQALESEVGEFQAQELPIVWLEEDGRRDELIDYVDRLKIKDRVFIVLTKPQTPDPLERKFIELAFQLEGVGLSRATVVGSRLIHNVKEGTAEYFGTDYSGCVARAVDGLNKVGVAASIGQSIQD